MRLYSDTLFPRRSRYVTNLVHAELSFGQDEGRGIVVEEARCLPHIQSLKTPIIVPT